MINYFEHLFLRYLCQMPYNKISPKTPTKTPMMMPKVDVEEDEDESSNVDEK